MTATLERTRTMHHHDEYLFPASERQSLDTLMADAIRVVRKSAVGLTPKESQLLSDVSRKGRDSRGLRIIAEVADIARYRCRDAAHASAIGEAVNRYILTGHPGLSMPWLDTLRYEGASNTMADDALIEHVLHPSPSTRERVIETHHAQAIASQAVVKLMLCDRR